MHSIFIERLGMELGSLAEARFCVLQAMRPLRGKALGARKLGLIVNYARGHVGSRAFGLMMMGHWRRAGRRKPGKVDYGKPVPDKRRERKSPPQRPGAVGAVADQARDEHPC